MTSIDQGALSTAYARTLLPGLKPEDYYLVGPKFPIQIARMIVAEYQHILEMRRRAAE